MPITPPPEYEVVSGYALPGAAGTTSDKNGISACIVCATNPGVKTLSLTNAKVGLKQNVTFSLPAGGHLLNTISAAGVNIPTTARSVSRRKEPRKNDIYLGELTKGRASNLAS